MLLEPKIIFREAQPYAAIRTKVKMMEIPQVLPPLIPQVLQWVEKNKLQQVGPVFFRYLTMNSGTMEAEVGVPLNKLPQADGKIIAATFPAGKYVTAKHMGPYTNLPKSHMALENFLKENGLQEKGVEGEQGEKWGTRAEFYITHPDEVKDEAKWETELLLMVS